MVLGPALPHAAQDTHGIFFGIAGMDDQRQIGFDTRGDMVFENTLLHIARRVVVIII